EGNSGVIITGGANFEKDISSGISLVDFWAEWCGPCKMMLPVLEQLTEKIGNKAKIMKLNVDENLELTQNFRIMSIPCIIIFKNGKEVDRLVGVRDVQELEDFINKIA
ncbi:MAG: thioredoxin, partial [Candidatus Gracilibacteria bacterium]|nr:thioredoxin [Candidatus Gracilibacteria bacterium]